MGMQVDLTQPISDDERAYLLSRNREADVAANDRAFGDGEPLATPGVAGTEPSLGADQVPADSEDGGAEYEDMSHADLDAEIDARNEDLPDDEQISKSGTIAQKAARLREDDAASG